VCATVHQHRALSSFEVKVARNGQLPYLFLSVMGLIIVACNSPILLNSTYRYVLTWVHCQHDPTQISGLDSWRLHRCTNGRYQKKGCQKKVGEKRHLLIFYTGSVITQTIFFQILVNLQKVIMPETKPATIAVSRAQR
jgi:hypothetical protein